MQEERIVAIYSHKFNNTEINYTTPEKESLAIHLALIKFRTLLFMVDLIIETDNKNILFH